MMSENPETFVFKILFDREQTNCEKLEEQARKILREYLGDIILEVGETTSGHPLLSITSTLERVDSCHREITKILIGELKRHHFRLIDEAGDEIRKRAYPILAELEQELRAFVNQSIVEVLGFEWWTSLGEVEIPGIDRAKGELYETHHPLELTQFDDLLKIMTTEVAQWEADRALSQADLLELLTESESPKHRRRLLHTCSSWASKQRVTPAKRAILGSADHQRIERELAQRDPRMARTLVCMGRCDQ